jgi:hypothetical protein
MHDAIPSLKKERNKEKRKRKKEKAGKSRTSTGGTIVIPYPEQA